VCGCRLVNEKKEGVVFLLWGGFAIKKAKDVNKKRHHVLEAAHPSPLVRTLTNTTNRIRATAYGSQSCVCVCVCMLRVVYVACCVLRVVCVVCVVCVCVCCVQAGGKFLGCKHFSKCNELLEQMGKEPIDWTLGP
jgi:uracil DNA glycosylase